MANKVTLQDLAQRAGVHRSTVSLALRDHPRISEPVRKKIQSLAQRLGYSINPLVAALMQSRRTKRAARNVVIAYVTNYPSRYGWRPPHHDRPDYFPGAAARAQELGYKLEHFWLAEPGMTPQRFCEILTARGIHGLLVGRLPPGQRSIDIKWERFSCVALGATLQSPILHRVAEDYFSGAWEVIDQMTGCGYQRIGFVSSDADDSPRVGERWLGAYLRQQLHRTSKKWVKPFFFEQSEQPAKSFQAWFARNKPDALLVTHAEPVIEWLRQIGVRVPADVGLAALVNDHPERGWSGVHSSAEKLGALAADMLIGMMYRGEKGVPADPHEILLVGDWQAGRTLKRSV